MMKIRYFNRVSILLMFVLAAYGWAQKRATTEDGEDVILYDDGTWKYAEQIEISKRPYLIETPPFNGKIAKSTVAIKPVKLRKQSAKPNDITDTDEWFRANNLSLPTYQVPNSFRRIKGDCPDKTPSSFMGNILVKAIYSDKYTFLIYGSDFSEGRYLMITDRKLEKVFHLLDFKNYVYAPEYVREDYDFIAQRINWVDIEGKILYISHSHSTYASSSKGMNAYITAIDLDDYRVVWRTKPLICNTHNFEIIGDVIIAGYGFTAEPDFLHSINRHSGEVIERIKLKTGPDYIIRKGNKLYVRTYDMDYVFLIEEGIKSK